MTVRADRLALRVSGLSAGDARRLAELIAAALAAADRPGRAIDVDRLRVAVAPRPGETVEAIASRIAAELQQTLARTS